MPRTLAALILLFGMLGQAAFAQAGEMLTVTLDKAKVLRLDKPAAIVILAKPENKGMLIFFRGMERVRFRAPVHAGDQVVIEATVKRLKSRMGVLEGRARVGKKVVIHGTMTFALGSE